MRVILHYSSTLRVVFFPHILAYPQSLRFIVTPNRYASLLPPIATLHWGLFKLSPSDYSISHTFLPTPNRYASLPYAIDTRASPYFSILHSQLSIIHYQLFSIFLSCFLSKNPYYRIFFYFCQIKLFNINLNLKK